MDYGITPEQIAGRLNGFKLTTTHAPTKATVEEIIEESTARVNGYLVGKGIGMPLSGDAAHLARSIVIKLCIAEVEQVRSRSSTDLTRAVWDQAQEDLALIARSPAFTGAPTGSRQADTGVAMGGHGSGACCAKPTFPGGLLGTLIKTGKM